jgi:AraC family transcriptional regulator
LAKHVHEHRYFCLVLRGAYTESCRSNTLDCKPMTVLYRAPGEPHSDRFHDAGGHCCVAEVPTAWVDRLCPGPMKAETSEYQGGALPYLALRLCKELRSWDDVSTFAIQGLLLEMLAVVCRNQSSVAERPTAPWLERCREILHARFRERICLDEIALAVNVHASHLARTFRQHHRCTMGEYVRRLRIDFACQQLASAGATLMDVALDAGFCDQSQFCKMFKRHTGLTPSEFRRLNHTR